MAFIVSRQSSILSSPLCLRLVASSTELEDDAYGVRRKLGVEYEEDAPVAPKAGRMKPKARCSVPGPQGAVAVADSLLVDSNSHVIPSSYHSQQPITCILAAQNSSLSPAPPSPFAWNQLRTVQYNLKPMRSRPAALGARP